MSRRPVTVLVTLLGLALLAPAASARPTPRPAPVLYEHATQPAPGGRVVAKREQAPWTADMIVRTDGTWWARGDVAGKLTTAELRKLKRAISATRYRIDRGVYAICTGIPYRRERVKTTVGTLSWASPCAARPDKSVSALEQLVFELTVARTLPRPEPIHPIVEPIVAPHEPIVPPATPITPAATLVRYSTERLQGLGKDDGILVRVDGTWRAGGREGVLHGGELAALRNQLASVTFGGSPTKQFCAARLDGWDSIEAPGYGSHRWSVPCGGTHPSLGRLISELRRLTR